MKMMQGIVIAIISALGSAQQQRPASPPPLSMAETARPPLQMRALADALAGTWSVRWIDNKGAVIGEGKEVWKIAPGGSAFIEENRSRVNGKPAEDYAAMWWDGKAQKIHGVWCDAGINDEGCSGFGVTVEGKEIVLTGEWEYQGKRQAWREIYSSTGMMLTQTLYIGDPGKELKLSSTIRGTKQ